MKTIYLVRHAKSSWKNRLLSDRERPLNKRGKENAPFMAERLKSRGGMPDIIISSPAKRAQVTAKKIAVGIGFDWQAVRTEESLYFHDPLSLLEVIQSTNEKYQSIMLVGHNPDMTDLLNGLADHVTGNMPTCAIATLSVNSKWQDVSLGSAELIHYDYPKKDIKEGIE